MLTKTIFCKLPARAAVRSEINRDKHISFPVLDPLEPPCLPQVQACILLKEHVLVGGHTHVRMLPEKHTFFEGRVRLHGAHHCGLLHSRQKIRVRQFAPCLHNRNVGKKLEVTEGTRTGIKLFPLFQVIPQVLCMPTRLSRYVVLDIRDFNFRGIAMTYHLKLDILVHAFGHLSTVARG